MNEILQSIVDRVNAAVGEPEFLDVLFGAQRKFVDSTPIVLFGAGALGVELAYALKREGIEIACFCDNDARKQGTMLGNRPVITLSELVKKHRDSFIVIAVDQHGPAIVEQLKCAGFDEHRLLRKPTDPDADILVMYAMVGSQTLFQAYQDSVAPMSIWDYLLKRQDAIKQACDAFIDPRSKALYIAKLAVFASNMHYAVFKDFMLRFSEPLHEFGSLKYRGTPEDYYYFNNDVYSLDPNEIYLDVGAYDGDSVATFVEACTRSRVKYQHIYALEPDPDCFKKLAANTADIANISLHEIGLWSETTLLEFVSSERAIHDQAGEISSEGTLKISVRSLDDFLAGEPVTLVKMDPSGVVAEAVLKGAVNTLRKYKPKLAIGIYHSLDEFINVPIFFASYFPGYQLFLRHNTYHLCDTDLLAIYP